MSLRNVGISALCTTIVPVLVISVLLRLTSSQITEYNLFVVSKDPVKLTAKNISKDSATLQWNLSEERKSKLKALRVNCTRVGSLVEPFIKEENGHILINPSVFKSNITIFNLMSASLYTCNLVGALSLELGQEKLIILSEPVTFSTLLENTDRNFKLTYGISTLKIILGGVIPVVLVIIATILIFIGYKKYKHTQKKHSDREAAKYHMYLSKDGENCGDTSTIPGTDKPAEGSKASKQEKSTKRKKPKDGTKGNSKTNVLPVEAYSYRELASDENSCPFFYDDEVRGNELAWDPIIPHTAPLLGKASLIYANKSINTRNTSSPSVHMKKISQRNILSSPRSDQGFYKCTD